jgi:hypothetical protein
MATNMARPDQHCCKANAHWVRKYIIVCALASNMDQCRSENPSAKQHDFHLEMDHGLDLLQHACRA